jgi:hypothetical protein
MTKTYRRCLVGLVAGAAAIMTPAAMAWACVGLVSLTATPNTAQPGGTLTVVGKEFAAKAPVLIHLDTITGPVLATAPPPTSTMTSQFKIQVTLPADISVGPHLLIATQDEHNMNGGNPARAQIYVGTSAPAASAPAARPTTLAAKSGLSLAVLAIIALAVAGVTLFLAGLVFLVVSRRRPETQAVKAQ